MRDERVAKAHSFVYNTFVLTCERLDMKRKIKFFIRGLPFIYISELENKNKY